MAKRNDFKSLPQEVKLRIFSYFKPEELCRFVAPVCKSWWKLSKDVSLWRAMEFDIRDRRKLKLCCKIIKQFNLLRSVNFMCSIRIDSAFKSLSSLKMLVELSLFRTLDFVDEDSLKIITSNCKHIEILTLRNCVPGVDIEAISHVVTLPKLRALDLSTTHTIDDDCLKLIGRNCSRLEVLNIANIFGDITDDGISLLAEYRKDTLKHLYFSTASVQGNCLEALKACQNLVGVAVTILDLDGDPLKHLFSLQNLLCLELTMQGCWSNEILNALFSSPCAANLQVVELTLNCFVNDIVKNIARTCRNLRVLNISPSWVVDDDCLLTVLENCKMLSMLSLHGGCRVTDRSVSQIPVKLPGLKYLSAARICTEEFYNRMLGIVSVMPNIKVYCGKKFPLNWKFGETICFHLNSQDVVWIRNPEDNCGIYSCTLQKPKASF